jgi:hypothetical protein
VRRWMAALALLVVLFVPALTRVQDVVRLNAVSVDIWPEYDKPAVLVIYHFVLPSNAALPAELTLHVPASVTVEAQSNATVESVAQGDQTLLTLTVNSHDVQFEYYEPLVKDGMERHIVFQWLGDYAVGILEVNFLRPSGAENVTLEPQPVDTSPGQNGLLNYHTRELDLASGQTYTLTIDYSRQTNKVSLTGLPIHVIATPGADTAGRVSMTGAIVPWALAGLGALLIIGGVSGFVAWQRGGKRTPANTQPGLLPDEREADSTYCPRCGERVQAGDAFCRSCGARLRRGS